VNLTFDSSVTARQEAWARAAYDLLSFPFDSLDFTVTVQTVDEPLCPGHSDYMCTSTDGDGYLIQIRSHVDEAAAKVNESLEGDEVERFFKEAFIHELGHVVRFSQMTGGEMATGAPLWHHEDSDAEGTLAAWADVGPGGKVGDSKWAESLEEATAELFKDAYYDDRVFDQATNWRMPKENYETFMDLLCPNRGAPVFVGWDNEAYLTHKWGPSLGQLGRFQDPDRDPSPALDFDEAGNGTQTYYDYEPAPPWGAGYAGPTLGDDPPLGGDPADTIPYPPDWRTFSLQISVNMNAGIRDNDGGAHTPLAAPFFDLTIGDYTITVNGTDYTAWDQDSPVGVRGNWLWEVTLDDETSRAIAQIAWDNDGVLPFTLRLYYYGGDDNWSGPQWNANGNPGTPFQQIDLSWGVYQRAIYEAGPSTCDWPPYPYKDPDGEANGRETTVAKLRLERAEHVVGRG
jgi:hypothetical protein